MDEEIKLNIAKALMWLGGIIVLGWALLKSFEIIESPIWVEMLPYMGVGISIVGGAYWFGRKIESIDGRFNKVDERFNRNDEKVDKLLNLKEEFIKVKHN